MVILNSTLKVATGNVWTVSVLGSSNVPITGGHSSACRVASKVEKPLHVHCTRAQVGLLIEIFQQLGLWPGQARFFESSGNF